jgi:hypothetical protein
MRPLFGSSEQYLEELARHVAELSSLQNVLYADSRYSPLLIFQAVDAAGQKTVPSNM